LISACWVGGCVRGAPLSSPIQTRTHPVPAPS